MERDSRWLQLKYAGQRASPGGGEVAFVGLPSRERGALPGVWWKQATAEGAEGLRQKSVRRFEEQVPGFCLYLSVILGSQETSHFLVAFVLCHCECPPPAHFLLPLRLIGCMSVALLALSLLAGLCLY